MSIGLYDDDMITYTYTAPNLELMKLAAYYRQKQQITVMTKNFRPDMYTRYIFRKDYDNGSYPYKFRAFKNIECGGLAFSNGIYAPMPLEIEEMIPDRSIYEVYKDVFGTSKTRLGIFKTCLAAQHLRLSLDGKTLWNNYTKQIISKKDNYFFHDVDLNAIKDSDLIIQDLVKNTTNSPKGYISTKFPLQIYNEKDLMKWINFKWSENFFTLNYNGLMSDDCLKELLERCRGTSKMYNIQYFVTNSFSNQQDFVENGIEKIYSQLMLACTQQSKILLKYKDGFFQDKRWERLIELWNCYNDHIVNQNKKQFNDYRTKRTLKNFVRSFKEKKTKYMVFTIQEARELFLFVKENNYELFCRFYEEHP